MEDTRLTQAIDHALEVKLKAVDKLVEELVTPLTKVGSPEDLIGKDYDQWSAQDLQLLTSIYGTAEPSLLSNLIFRKTYDKVRELEQEEENL